MSTLPTVNVTVNVVDAAGAPVYGAAIVFRLNRLATVGGFAVPTNVTALTDAAGVAVVPLCPNALCGGSYAVRISASGIDSRGVAYIPNEDCLLDSVFQSVPYPERTYVEAALVEVSNVQTLATAAATSATTATTQAGLATTAAGTATTQAGMATTAAETATTKAAEAVGFSASAQGYSLDAAAAKDTAIAAVASVNLPVITVSDAGKYLQVDPTGEGYVASEVASPATTQITNAGFGVWSNGTLESVGSAITVTNITSGVCTTTNTQGIVAGRLVYFAAGGNAAVASKLFEVTAVTTNTNFTLHDTTVNPGAVSSTTANEYTVGCVAADTKACDGWDKASGVLVYREQINVKEGSYYALKVVGGASVSTVMWSDGGRAAKPEFYSKYAGRATALGMWARCSSASKARIGITDSAGTAWSGYHSGGGSYEWLEVTRTPGTGITSFNVVVDSGTSTTAYFSQPQLMFGASIGSGNFVPIPGEWIYVPKFTSKAYPGVSVSSIAAKAINICVDSNGALPKTAKAVDVLAAFWESVSSFAMYLGSSSSSLEIYTLAPTTSGYNSTRGVVPIVTQSTIYILIDASGTNTARPSFAYVGVQL